MNSSSCDEVDSEVISGLAKEGQAGLKSDKLVCNLVLSGEQFNTMENILQEEYKRLEAVEEASMSETSSSEDVQEEKKQCCAVSQDKLASLKKSSMKKCFTLRMTAPTVSVVKNMLDGEMGGFIMNELVTDANSDDEMEIGDLPMKRQFYSYVCFEKA